MRRRGRLTGMGIVIALVLGLGTVGTFVLGRSYSELALSKEPFDRNQYVPSFDPIEDVTLGLSPNSSNVIAEKPNALIHAIEIYPTQTILLAGGQAVKTFDVRAPSTLHSLVSLVHDNDWISESGHIVSLHAAVILQHGAAMSISAPTTTEVVMRVKSGVFIAANESSRLSLDGVYVHASDQSTPTTAVDPEASAGRPFIWAVSDSVMTVENSTFRYLGRDWNSSYGLSWSKGATGSVTNSVFEHDFIGVYSNGSPGLSVTHNTFSYNSLYGVDPHSGSTHQDIEYNTSDNNGRHGIIFSDHVTQSLVAHNTTKNNGLNGIMMDEESSGNRIFDNVVEDNHSDGVVLASSSGSTVDANAISGNRVGIVIRGTTTRTAITGNLISANKLAVQGSGFGGGHNRLSNNGGEWQAARIRLVWVSCGLLMLVLGSITGVGNWRRRRYRPQHVAQEMSLV